ncbi:MAG: hypothetical protein AAF217_07650 [Pseudomonadota bacterium]
MTHKLTKTGPETFLRNRSGETSIRMALVFGMAVIVITIVATPMLDKTSRQYAGNFNGIDNTITGSVKPVKRYTIRKTVMDKLKPE